MIIFTVGFLEPSPPQKAKKLSKRQLCSEKVDAKLVFFLAVETLYKKVGDDVVLRPVDPPISRKTITWKDGLNIAVEWEGQKMYYFRQYKGM